METANASEENYLILAAKDEIDLNTWIVAIEQCFTNGSENRRRTSLKGLHLQISNPATSADGTEAVDNVKSIISRSNSPSVSRNNSVVLPVDPVKPVLVPPPPKIAPPSPLVQTISAAKQLFPDVNTQSEHILEEKTLQEEPKHKQIEIVKKTGINILQ